MGSFDATCALSGLPIVGGTPVRYLLLMEVDPRREWPVYSTDWWAPRTFPLRARYSDCGEVADVEGGPQADAWIACLRRDVVECPADRWGDGEVRRGALTVDALASLMHGDYLTVEDRGRRPRLARAYVREDVWRAYTSCEVADGHDADYQVRRATLSTYVRYAREYYESMLALAGNGPQANGLAVRSAVDDAMQDNPVARLALPSTESTLRVGLAAHLEAFAVVDSQPPPAEVDAFLQVVAETCLVGEVLRQTCGQWRPSAYGGQSPAYDLHVGLLRRVADAAEDARRAAKEEEDGR